MILGIDHLALNTIDPDSIHLELDHKGYKCVFTENDILNHPEKKPFLHEFRSKHDIALYKHGKDRLAVEVTRHGDKYFNNSEIFLADNVLTVKVPEDKINKEIQFWIEYLKFKEIDAQTYKFTSVFPQWSCELKFEVAGVVKNESKLDDNGYTCLAFITNNINNDLKNIKGYGIGHMTTVFNLTVNKQDLSIALFRTPAGLICEFIQIIRN
jgi:hypothetical protein